MIQPLNYLPKAISDLEEYQSGGAPLSRAAFGYLADKMRQAQAFLLPDCGQLLDRNKPRPEMPGLVFKPPYPVTALEYQAVPGKPETPGMSLICSKRIALAWEWEDDFPASLRSWLPNDLGAGVVVAAIIYVDQSQGWIPVSVAAHFSYDSEWLSRDVLPIGPLQQAMVTTRRVSPKAAAANSYPFRPLVVLPEAVAGLFGQVGEEAAIDMLCADLMDELNAYHDLCYALACRNVTVEAHPAPTRLNAARAKAGRTPLFDYHVLKLVERDGARGQAVGETHGASPRPHLRRGHIRHLRYLGPNRITWVNATMVRGSGRGFVAKDYAVEGSAA